ncbi:anion transporter [Leptolyngbya sp. O-77]|uniref:anion transporter n=1 Tax=Leptolyngbya sp. O-77 TaxID=1080068 RepID=UPI000A7E1200|nr:anion transporter [Leptolyngbya sp. O-77]
MLYFGIAFRALAQWLPVAQAAVIGLTYVGLALGSVPGLRMNRATMAIAGTAALIALGTLSLKEAWQAIDPTTIVFLLSTMIVNAYLSYAGFFQLALLYLIRLTSSPFGLLVALTLGCGALSAVFLNDTIALVFTPLTVSLAQTLSLNPVPYLLALAAATNIGSVATLNGNPQNILVGSFSGIAYAEFARVMIPIALMGLLLQIGLLGWMYPDVRSLKPRPYVPTFRPRAYRPLLRKTLLVSSLMLAAFVVGLPLAESALAATGVLLITRRIKPQRVLQDVDWGLLVIFSGLFVLTRSLQSFNLLSGLLPWIAHPVGLVSITTLLSNLISNVPAVLLLQSLIDRGDKQSWLLLAVSSTLAGNLTLFGAVANLITAEAAASQGYSLSFWTHLRFGLPLTLATLAIATTWVLWQG